TGQSEQFQPHVTPLGGGRGVRGGAHGYVKVAIVVEGEYQPIAADRGGAVQLVGKVPERTGLADERDRRQPGRRAVPVGRGGVGVAGDGVGVADGVDPLGAGRVERVDQQRRGRVAGQVEQRVALRGQVQQRDRAVLRVAGVAG